MVVPRSRSTAPPSTSSRPAPAGWDRVTLLPGLAFSISGSRRAPGSTRRTATAPTVAATNTIGTTADGRLSEREQPAGNKRIPGARPRHRANRAPARGTGSGRAGRPELPTAPDIDHPHELRPGPEPVGHLGEHVGGSVLGRHDLGE